MLFCSMNRGYIMLVEKNILKAIDLEYSRSLAIFPISWLKENENWPALELAILILHLETFTSDLLRYNADILCELHLSFLKDEIMFNLSSFGKETPPQSNHKIPLLPLSKLRSLHC